MAPLAVEGVHQREEAIQVRGQVYVHVDQDVGVTLQPRPLQGPPAALLRQVDDADLGVSFGQGVGDGGGSVGGAVVGHGDAPGVGHMPAEVGQQGLHAAGQVMLLVVDGEDDVDQGRWQGRPCALSFRGLAHWLRRPPLASAI